MSSSTESRKNRIIDLDVGGRTYSTTIGTLMHEPGSVLAQCFAQLAMLDSQAPPPLPPSSSLSLSSSSCGRSRSPTHPISSAGSTRSASRHSVDHQIIQKRSDDSYFIDRDGDLFRYVLDYLRSSKIVLPENFVDLQRLREEARFFKLNELLKQLKLVTPTNNHGRRGTLPALANGTPNSMSSSAHSQHARGTIGASSISSTSGVRLTHYPSSDVAPLWGYITVGYRGTFAFGRDGQADVKFRKLSRLLVCGRIALCRDVFGDSLNESRDPDRGGENRYTARLYLKHSSLELAFDTLSEQGFTLVTSCASGTCASAGDLLRGSSTDCEEQKWNHYNEFVFYRPRNTSILTE